MIIKQALFVATTKLFNNKIKFPQLEAEILLSHIIKKPRVFLFAHPEAELTQLQITNYQLQIKKRLRGAPIAYLTGEKEFYGLKFLVNKNVLIPRPETELMVEEAVKLARRISTPITFVDVGTGSGCIITSIAKVVIFNFQFSIFKQFPIFNFQFIGTDISKQALAIAKKNAKLHGVEKKIKFINGDLLAPIINSKFKIQNSKFIILANLPYLTPVQIKNSPTIKHEPRLALTAGKDGLKYYRKLFIQINKLPITNYYIFCEIDPSQKTSIRRLAKTILPPHFLEIKKDLRGHNRLAIITSKR